MLKSSGQDQGDEMSPEEASAEGETTEVGERRSCLDRRVGAGFMKELDALSLEGGLSLLRSLPLRGVVGMGIGQTPPGPPQSNCWYS